MDRVLALTLRHFFNLLYQPHCVPAVRHVCNWACNMEHVGMFLLWWKKVNFFEVRINHKGKCQGLDWPIPIAERAVCPKGMLEEVVPF